jgi:hypothetical protein
MLLFSYIKIHKDYSSVINLIFKGQMEYAIISFSVGENTFAWLFHVFNKLDNIRCVF